MHNFKLCWYIHTYMDVSENNGTPKSSILMRFSIINPSILGYPYFWKHPYIYIYVYTYKALIVEIPPRYPHVPQQTPSTFGSMWRGWGLVSDLWPLGFGSSRGLVVFDLPENEGINVHWNLMEQLGNPSTSEKLKNVILTPGSIGLIFGEMICCLHTAAGG